MGIEEIILEAVKEESFEKGMKKGIKEGRQEALLQITLRTKKAGFSTADIAKATGLTKEQIKKV
jgi:predicted transposase/invertase (TIGR01784 family)